MATSGDTAARPASAIDNDEQKQLVFKLDDIISDAFALLNAISHGGLLDALPAGDGDAAMHNTATRLIYMAEMRLREAEALLAGKGR